MPLYDYSCPKCGLVKDVWATMDEKGLQHDKCGMMMHRIISPTRINPDWQPYWEENMGHEPVYIKSRQHWKEELKNRGFICRG